MNTEPDQIRAQMEAMLAELPDFALAGSGPVDADIDEITRRLWRAHDMLVRALESAEKG